MPNELVKSPANGCTLYELEDNLQALANSIALAEDESTRELILGEIGRARPKTKESDTRGCLSAALRVLQRQGRRMPERSTALKSAKPSSRADQRAAGKLRRSVDRTVRPRPTGKGFSAWREMFRGVRVQKIPTRS